MFRIITLEREYGCGCAGIASDTRRPLGLEALGPLPDRRNCQAGQCGLRHGRTAAKRRIDGTFYRLAKTFWRGSYERSMPMDSRRPSTPIAWLRMMEDITAKIAEEGNAVVVGRGSPYFLRERNGYLPSLSLCSA